MACPLGLWNGRMMLGAEPVHCRVVHTNSKCNFSAGLALVKQGENIILGLLGDGFHDGMAECGGVWGLDFKLNGV